MILARRKLQGWLEVSRMSYLWWLVKILILCCSITESRVSTGLLITLPDGSLSSKLLQGQISSCMSECLQRAENAARMISYLTVRNEFLFE